MTHTQAMENAAILSIQSEKDIANNSQHEFPLSFYHILVPTQYEFPRIFKYISNNVSKIFRIYSKCLQ